MIWNFLYPAFMFIFTKNRQLLILSMNYYQQHATQKDEKQEIAQ